MTQPHHDDSTALRPDMLMALQAIAEPNRARILELLGHGEHCVCDVGDGLGVSTALVSHHLRVLRANGLLKERRAGRWVFYSLDVDRLADLREAIATLLTPSDGASTASVCSDCGTPPMKVVDQPPTEVTQLSRVPS